MSGEGEDGALQKDEGSLLVLPRKSFSLLADEAGAAGLGYQNHLHPTPTSFPLPLGILGVLLLLLVRHPFQ